jgi:hypothetical protein
LSPCETHHLAAAAMTSYRRNFVPGGRQFFTVNLDHVHFNPVKHG